MEPIYHVPLEVKPLNPNRAKWLSVGLSALGALIALWTWPQNYEYFANYYQGFEFWIRIIAFSTVEVTLILLPLFKGWGNPRQITAMWIFTAAIAILAAVHTGNVSDSNHTRLTATRSKAEASASFDLFTQRANEISERNDRRRKDYQSALAQWRRSAAIAERNEQSPGPMPVEPQYESVPQVDQKTMSMAGQSVEAAVEEAVPHKFLLRLLQVMVFFVIIAWTVMVVLADSMRLRLALLRERAKQLDHHLGERQEVRQLGQESGTQTPVERVISDENPFPREIPEPDRPNAPRR